MDKLHSWEGPIGLIDINIQILYEDLPLYLHILKNPQLF